MQVYAKNKSVFDKIISSHIFLFPFKWELKDNKKDSLFSDKIDLDRILINQNSNWRRMTGPSSAEGAESLYNEKNYFYPFVHKILYDDGSNEVSNLIRHYERVEPSESNGVRFVIKVKDRENPYLLEVKYINLNLYATGIGVISFYLHNTRHDQSDSADILNINQYGRRVMPSFLADVESRIGISEYIQIEGLNTQCDCREDFKNYTAADFWTPAAFVSSLVSDLSNSISLKPVIDERMFVMSWYKNDELCESYTTDPMAYCDLNSPFSSFWYKYLFVDNEKMDLCQNDEMKTSLLKNHTYLRWQKKNSLYGVSRCSFVYLSCREAEPFLLDYFETIYERMVELVLVQRASMLRFSQEVTELNDISHSLGLVKMSEHISSLYKEYIRFLNQVYFREVSAQEQGIELYSILHSSLKLEVNIKDLDGEIEELFQYVSLREDRERNEKVSALNFITTIFIPVTVITTLFEILPCRELLKEQCWSFWIQVLLIIIGMVLMNMFVNKNKSKRKL